MFNFFFALFGGLYYGGRYAIEKGNDYAYEMSMVKCRRLSQYYEEMLRADGYTTDEIEEYVLNGENYNEICENFAEDFQYIYGDDWKSILHIPSQLDGGQHNDSRWVYRLILASKGKLDFSFFISGYEIPYVTAITEKKRYEQWCRQQYLVKFCKRIEFRLNEALKEIYPEMEYVTFAIYGISDYFRVTLSRLLDTDNTQYLLLRDFRRLLTFYEEKLQADWFTKKKVEEYVLSGENYEKICQEFEEDFQCVYGDDWKSFLRIPPFKDNEQYFDVYWVQKLILASKGKVEPGFFLDNGYKLVYAKAIKKEDRHEKRRRRQLHLKFCERIELRLNKVLKETYPDIGYVTFDRHCVWSNADGHYIYRVTLSELLQTNLASHLPSQDYQKLSRYYEEKLQADEDTTKEVKEYVLSGENYDEIYEAFKEDFQYVYGDDWKSVIEIPPKSQCPCRACDTDSDVYWVYRLLLASKGKIDLLFFSSGGYRITYDKAIRKEKGGQRRRLKFCKRIELRLNEILKRTNPEMGYVAFAIYGAGRGSDRRVSLAELCKSQGVQFDLLSNCQIS